MFFRLIRRLEAEGRIGSGLTFRGLRHTAGKMLDEAGCDTRTIGVVLGDRSEVMARHYSEEGDRRRRGGGDQEARAETNQKMNRVERNGFAVGGGGIA
jgi:integrase